MSMFDDFTAKKRNKGKR